MEREYFAKVVKIIDAYKVVINKGSFDGVNSDSRFLIIEIGERLIDPDTKESLGFLEITKGWCAPTHIQNNMCTIKSNEFAQNEDITEITKTKANMIVSIGGTSVTEVTKPGKRYRLELEDVKVGDSIIARGIQPIEF